jgi:hypothetical protein
LTKSSLYNILERRVDGGAGTHTKYNLHRKLFFNEIDGGCDGVKRASRLGLVGKEVSWKEDFFEK